MSEHTPGPWVAGHWGNDSAQWWVNAKDTHICCVDGESASYEADARLIAAAPDLLAALKELRSTFGAVESDEYGRDPLLASVDAAIAKASGTHP